MSHKWIIYEKLDGKLDFVLLLDRNSKQTTDNAQGHSILLQSF